MLRGRGRKSVTKQKTLDVETKNKLKIRASNLAREIMAVATADANLSHVLSLISPFDGKKINNVTFYLEKLDSFMDRINNDDDFKLRILKAKLVGAARETLASDQNRETD